MTSKHWSKSYKRVPPDNIIIRSQAKSKPFAASFASDQSPPLMKLIMNWEYGRNWLTERDAFKAKSVVKPKKFTNDYKHWLEKRKKKPNKQ